MEKCVLRSDVFDKAEIQGRIVDLALSLHQFGCRLAKVKFCIVDHGKEVRVFQCALHDISLSAKEGVRKAVSIISEVDE